VGRSQLFHALLEQGKIPEAEKVHAMEGRDEQGTLELLTFSLGSRLAGDAARAKRSLDLALKGLQEGPPDYKAAGELLASGDAPTEAQVSALSIPPQSKAILAAVLRFQHPEQSARFAEIARRLNVERVFPYHLIQRSVASQQ
jgi:hypothetical protein